MSTPQHDAHSARHPAWQTMSRPKVWAVPVAIVLFLMGLLSAMYLAANIHASESLHSFPVTIVNQDRGAKLADGTPENVGKQISDGILTGVDREKFDLHQSTLEEATSQMDQGVLYGAIVIPKSFSADLLNFAASANSRDPVARPTVTVLTNPRTGTGTPSIVTSLGTAALGKAQTSVGQQLTTETQKMAETAGGAPLSGAAQSALAQPFTIDVTPYHPLPDGTGNGLSAFYYALLLVLAGFTGSMIVSTFVDSSLGFVPSEMGPRYLLENHSGMSRLATLVAKWVIMAGVALGVAAVYVGISYAVNMPVDHPWELFGFSAAMIWAVAVVAQTISAIFGGVGLLINLFLFIVFSLPSAGGAIPLEATPQLFRWLGAFEPMHQIYLGARSVLYLGGSWDSGLGRALIFGAAAVVLGLSIGWLAMRHYDRKGYIRGHQLQNAN